MAAFACEYALILSPGRQTDRVTFGVTILLAIIVLHQTCGATYDRKGCSICTSLGMTVLLLFAFYQGVNGAYDVVNVVNRPPARQYVKLQVAKGLRRSCCSIHHSRTGNQVLCTIYVM